MDSRTVRIAVTQSSCGHLTFVGPDDYKPTEFRDAMDAAFSWSVEADYIPTSRYWLTVEIPAPSADIPDIAGALEEHHE